MAITNLSAAQLRRAAGLRDKIDQLEKKLASVLGEVAFPAPGAGNVRRGKAAPAKRNVSKAARAKMAAAAKARWAKVKAAGKNRL